MSTPAPTPANGHRTHGRTQAGTPGSPRHGRPWAPQTSAGRWAVGLTALSGALMLVGLLAGVMPDWALGPRWGANLTPLAIPAGIGGAACAIVGVFRRGDRGILVWLALVPAVLISLFWVAFIVAELVSPHD